MSLSIVENVSWVTFTVSGQGHIQFMSMCAWPQTWMVYALAALPIGASIFSASPIDLRGSRS